MLGWAAGSHEVSERSKQFLHVDIFMTVTRADSKAPAETYHLRAAENKDNI